MIITGIIFIVLSAMFIVVGSINCTGNIETIHFYNRQNVTEKNRKKYGRLMGAGSIIIGLTMLVTGILMFITEESYIWYMLLSGVIFGVVLMFIASFIYNKGIF